MDFQGSRDGLEHNSMARSDHDSWLNTGEIITENASSHEPLRARPINIYGSTTASGNARVIQGDTFNISYYNSYSSHQGPSLLNPQNNIDLQRLVESAVLSALSSSAASAYPAYRSTAGRSSRQPHSSYTSQLAVNDSGSDGDDDDLRARFDTGDELGFEDAFDESVQFLRGRSPRQRPAAQPPDDGTRTPRPRFPIPTSASYEHEDDSFSLRESAALETAHILSRRPTLEPQPAVYNDGHNPQQSQQHITLTDRDLFAQAGAQFTSHDSDCHPRTCLESADVGDHASHLSRWLVYGTPWHHNDIVFEGSTFNSYIDHKTMAIGLTASRFAGHVTLPHLTGKIPGSHVVSLLIDTWQWHPSLNQNHHSQVAPLQHTCDLTADLDRLELSEALTPGTMSLSSNAKIDPIKTKSPDVGL